MAAAQNVGVLRGLDIGIGDLAGASTKRSRQGSSPGEVAGPSPAPGRDRPAILRNDALPEVRAFEVHAPDGLVHRPQRGIR